MDTLLRRRMMIANGGEPPAPPVTATFVPSSLGDDSVYQSFQTNYPASNAYTDADSTTYCSVKWKNGVEAETKMYWKFDTSSIPANATIVSVSAIAKASLTATSYQTGKSYLCLCEGTVEKGSPVTANSTTAKQYTLDGGSGWTRESLQDIAVLYHTQRGSSNETASYYQRFYGATLTITYTLPSEEEE